METRTFGKSDLRTSVIGFGGWPMGRGHYGAFDDQEVVRAIHAALDAGVTLYDTAAVYGNGYSEELLGKALGKRRKDVIVVTKGGSSGTRRPSAMTATAPRPGCGSAWRIA